MCMKDRSYDELRSGYVANGIGGYRVELNGSDTGERFEA